MLKLKDPKIIHDLSLLFAQEQFRLYTQEMDVSVRNVEDNALLLAGFYQNARSIYEQAIKDSQD